MKRNVLWIMADQHNAGCMGHHNPDVETPNLDALSGEGVEFTSAMANNPICAPSRVSFMNGQYVTTHRVYGNYICGVDQPNEEMLPRQFQKMGYETCLVGKAHLPRKWVEDSFEKFTLVDLIDNKDGDPFSVDYFRYLEERGLADDYEEGAPKAGQNNSLDGSFPAKLPYEHSSEHFSGNAALKFLEERDPDRPFFLNLSFQRPHNPISPAAEYFDRYDPAQLHLPESSVDWLQNKFAGKPEFMRERLLNGSDYPMAADEGSLRRVMASYYALITAIDDEIGRVIRYLKDQGLYENTIIVYVADHGDFAGEHGLFFKNLGIYDSVQRIPFILKYPGCPAGKKMDSLIQAVDLYPTLCELCGIPVPAGRDGQDLVSLIEGRREPVPAAFCDWEIPVNKRVAAIRTRRYRLVYYAARKCGELYDHETDDGEVKNLWNHPDYAQVQSSLLLDLMSHVMSYHSDYGSEYDRTARNSQRFSPSMQLQFHKKYWSDLNQAYTELKPWKR